MRTWAKWGVFAAGCAVWWFYVADLLARPHTYSLFIVYLVLVVSATAWHVRALYRFARMVGIVRREEQLGLIEEGSTMFAANQRFRYATRLAESMVVLAIAVMGTLTVAHPKLALNINYERLILTYFLGSVVVTGYLTYRDLRVLNRLHALEDAAFLVPVGAHDQDDPDE